MEMNSTDAKLCKAKQTYIDTWKYTGRCRHIKRYNRVTGISVSR